MGHLPVLNFIHSSNLSHAQRLIHSRQSSFFHQHKFQALSPHYSFSPATIRYFSSDSRCRRHDYVAFRRRSKVCLQAQAPENPMDDFAMLMCSLVDCAKDKTSGITIESESIPSARILKWFAKRRALVIDDSPFHLVGAFPGPVSQLCYLFP